MFDEVKELLVSTLKGAFSRDSEKKRTRKIIFWYDSKQEYKEFIDEVELYNTEIIEYADNSLWIRYHIEKEELNKNIIIYFPFDKPKSDDNNLLDLLTINYDLLFNPDSTTMRLKDLGLTEECRSVIKKYAKFFKDKKRETKFKEFDMDKNPDNIPYIITSILLNIKSINIDDIFKNIIKLYYDDTKKYAELFKLGSEEFIIELFNETFGSKVENVDGLPELYKSLIFTYFVSNIKNPDSKINRYGKYLLKNKATNVYVFINSLMRDKSTKIYFEKLSDEVVKEFGISDLLNELDIEDYKISDAFKCIDNNIIKYLVDKLFNGIGEFELYREYVDLRESKYWYDEYSNEYNLLKVVIDFSEKIKSIENKIKNVDIDEFAKNYTNNLYEIDTLYRKMYFYYDNIVDKDIYINLKNRIENMYINSFMIELSIKWSDSIESMKKYDSNRMIMQNKFYNNFIKPYKDKKDRVIVIVSDAFRYECAKELTDRLKTFSNKASLNYMLGLVPSYTKLGMASLLPNKELTRVENSDDILVDGQTSSSIKDRESIHYMK